MHQRPARNREALPCSKAISIHRAAMPQHGNVPKVGKIRPVYDRSDTDPDDMIKYTRTGNDRDILLTNVGIATPNSTRTRQLP